MKAPKPIIPNKMYTGYFEKKPSLLSDKPRTFNETLKLIKMNKYKTKKWWKPNNKNRYLFDPNIFSDVIDVLI